MKLQRYAVCLLLAVVLAATAWRSTNSAPAARPVTIAVMGDALRDSAALLVQRRAGTHPQRAVQIAVFDPDDPTALQRIVQNEDVVAVVGPVFGSAADEAVLAEHKIARLTLAGPPAPATAWSHAISADTDYEARFLADYVANVMGEKLVSIILPDGEEWADIATQFDETLRRFDASVGGRWSIPADGTARASALDASAHDIAAKPVAGVVLVLGDPEFAAHAVASLGHAGVGNRVIGLRDVASTEFRTTLAKIWHGPGPLALALDRIVFATPVLLDKAGTFQREYETAYHHAPDWVAVLGYDATNIIAAALDALNLPAAANGKLLRTALHDELARHDRPETALPGLVAPIFFGEASSSAIPTLIGHFDGSNMVAVDQLK